MEKHMFHINPDNFVCVDGKHSPSELYHIIYKDNPVETLLPVSGGDRVYSRLSSSRGKPVVIGTYGPDIAENRAFISLSEVFRTHGINVPHVYACDGSFHSYLQSDLGGDSLLPLLSTERRMPLSEASLAGLVGMQLVDEKEWSPYVFSRPFSRRMVMWDLNYFKYEFVKPCAVAFDEERLEDDFELFAEHVSRYEPQLWGFMYRDFQSRNVIIKDGEPWYIDFQGGRKGPLLYDAVSFLWQAKAGFSHQERELLLDMYAGFLSERRNISKDIILGRVGEIALLDRKSVV